VRHPNVVAIYDVGEDQGRPTSPWNSSRRQSGPTLAPAAAVPAAAELVRTLARAVQHAHEQHVIHRDLNRQTFSSAGSRNRPAGRHFRRHRLSSFGFRDSYFGLRPCQAPRQRRHRLDARGDVLGTASYMAPEQAAAISATSARLRHLCAGAILYECLTARRSWPTPDQTIEQVLHDEPAPPTRLRPGRAT